MSFRVEYVDWSKLPDILAVGLLSLAFASVARRSYTRASGIWLTGWLLIVLHFTSFLFLPAPGKWGLTADLVGVTSLVWAGLLFMWAAVPYRQERSSRWMLLVLLATNTICVCVLQAGTPASVTKGAAILLGVGPLAVALAYIRKFRHRLRWAVVVLYLGLGIFILATLRRADGLDLALNGVLFTVYGGCAIHFGYMYRRATAGSFITISGFFLWAFVFMIGPMMAADFPAIHVESEVWNLPKFVVGIGMILLLLEEQIEHNKHLALHDVLTGLPNRRLFQDRLAITLERARRTGTQAALLVLDLDHFKQVNDTMGHHVGDLLLQQVARLFSGRVRRSDTVARTGGDEFSVILDGPTHGAEALHVGRALQYLLKEPMILEDRQVMIGASFGMAIFPDDASDMEAMCIVADLRMYENKRKGELARSGDVPSEQDTGSSNARKSHGPAQIEYQE
jgi:diguanylate cyclase (GGDEF)-like protein